MLGRMPPPTEDEMIDFCVSCAVPLKTLHVVCAECNFLSRPLGFCLECFRFGVILGSHQPNHAYKLANIDRPLFRKKDAPSFSPSTPKSSSEEIVWNISAELALLEAVERYGLGWSVIEDRHAKSALFPTNPQKHYEKHYLSGPMANVAFAQFALPNCVIDRSAPLLSSLSNDRLPELGNVALEGIAGSGEEVTDSESMTAMASPEVNPQLVSPGVKGSKVGDLGWMPLRGEFEQEYDDNVEEMLSPLVPLPDDDDFQRNLFGARCQSYVTAVAERDRRKAIAQEHNLITKFFQNCSRLKRKKSKGKVSNVLESEIQVETGQSELPARKPSTFGLVRSKSVRRAIGGLDLTCLNRFSQFISRSDFIQLCVMLTENRLLRLRVRQLRRWKRRGLKRLIHGREYEKERKRNTDQSAADLQQPTPAAEPSLSSMLGGQESVPGCVTKEGDQPRSRSRQSFSPAELTFLDQRGLSRQDYLMLKAAVICRKGFLSKGYPVKSYAVTEDDSMEQKTLSDYEAVMDFLEERNIVTL